MFDAKQLSEMVKDPSQFDWAELDGSEEAVGEICEFLVMGCDGASGRPSYPQAWAFIADMPLFAPELFAPFVSKKTSRIENKAGWWYERYGSPVQHLLANSGNRETTGWSRNRMSQMVCAVGEHYIDMGAALSSNDAYKTGTEQDEYRASCLDEYIERHTR